MTARESTLPGVDPTARVHATALLEDGVRIGARSSVWDTVHIRRGAEVGSDSIVGEKTYIAYDVRIGNFVKINAMVYVCAEVTIEDGVMISAGTVFTNDLFPRAMNRELTGLEDSDLTEDTLSTKVETGVTIGAQATIGPGIILGSFAMVGMGAVVTRDVPPFALVVGNPARVVGYVCACGPRLVPEQEFALAESSASEILWECRRCRRGYGKKNGNLTLMNDPFAERSLLRSGRN